MSASQCEMCQGSGEGSGGYKGKCGYCNGTGKGACTECGYPSTEPSPAMCDSHDS